LKHLAIILLFACSLAAGAETLRGVVTNGTTKKPSAGDEVSLKRFGNGMEDAGQTITNAKGEFSFTVQPSQTHYLIWVKHENVLYTHVVQPGSGLSSIQVFEAASEVKNIKILEHMMILQSEASTLKVDELYTVENNSVPPRTKAGLRAFEVYLPDGATLQDAAAQPAGGMLLKAGLAPTGEKNKYGFAYPIRPGQTQLRLSYTLPYSGKLQLNPQIPDTIDHMLVVVPGSMTLVPASGAVYAPTSDPSIKNVNMFVASNVTPQQQLGFEIQGSGKLPRDDQQASAAGPSASGQGEDNRPGGGLGVPNERPDPLHSGQWIFLGVLSAFLALGAIFVYLSNRQGNSAGQIKPQERPAMLLEAMKEEIFQLETDRLQGKISPKDYTAAKAALDQTLQRAVARQKSASKTAPSA
jgi:hypothetical protein